MIIQTFGFVLNTILDPDFYLPSGVRRARRRYRHRHRDRRYTVGLCLLPQEKILPQVRFTRFGSLSLSFGRSPGGRAASLMMLTMSIYVMFPQRLHGALRDGLRRRFRPGDPSGELCLPADIRPVQSLCSRWSGCFYGAKRSDLVRSISWYGIGIGLLASAAIGAVFYAFPVVFLKLFTRDRLILMIGSSYLRIDVFTFRRWPWP